MTRGIVGFPFSRVLWVWFSMEQHSYHCHNEIYAKRDENAPAKNANIFEAQKSVANRQWRLGNEQVQPKNQGKWEQETDSEPF